MSELPNFNGHNYWKWVTIILIILILAGTYIVYTKYIKQDNNFIKLKYDNNTTLNNWSNYNYTNCSLNAKETYLINNKTGLIFNSTGDISCISNEDVIFTMGQLYLNSKMLNDLVLSYNQTGNATTYLVWFNPTTNKTEHIYLEMIK